MNRTEESLIDKPSFSNMEQCCRHPWDAAVRPFPMADHVYYVSGNNWVASYLLDTGEGLILIDTAMTETLYLLTESIRQLGFNPTDIKCILLSHAHRDHFGGLRALQEYTKAKVYMSREDYEFMNNYHDLIFHGNYTLGEFKPDEFYDDNVPITFGRFTIHTVLTPGHTPGTTSFFFDVEDKEGRILHCGLHGGVGLNTLSNEYLDKNGLPRSLRKEFIKGLQKFQDKHIDICLPSHTNQYEILALAPQIRENYNPFIDSSVWGELMRRRLISAQKLEQS